MNRIKQTINLFFPAKTHCGIKSIETHHATNNFVNRVIVTFYNDYCI